MRHAVSRAIALFLGCFSTFNLIAEARCATFAPNLWWIDLRQLPLLIEWPLMLVSTAMLVAFGTVGIRSNVQRVVSLLTLGLLLLMAVWNVVSFYHLASTGAILVGVPVPLSFAVVAGLGLILREIAVPPTARTRFQRLVMSGTFALCCGLFPLAMMYCFGKTDYRRPAEAIVVFGARAYADGTPSAVLEDRVRTACQLHREGLARVLVFSGGPGDGAIHETESMRSLAIELGVPAESIVLDANGLNTWSTARNSREWIESLPTRRILAVSHFYHLPRIKLAFHRTGYEVYTVPADEHYRLIWMPLYVAREVVAFWAYYLRAVFG